MKLTFSLTAAAFGLAMLAAPAAQAFTIDNQSNTTSSGSARYSDPDSQFDNDGNKQTTIKQGDTTFRFGGQQGSFDQRYNTDRMFDPMGRPER
jgi:opacity protein-like surface antigen